MKEPQKRGGLRKHREDFFSFKKIYVFFLVMIFSFFAFFIISTTRFNQLLGEFGYRVSFAHLCFYENWEANGMQLTRGWSIEGGAVTDNVCVRGRSKGRQNVLFAGPKQR